jgi:CBS domain-containing protein
MEASMRVHDVMTTEVATARPDAPLKELAAQLAERGISGMPVVDDEGVVVGVVSEADVLAKALPGPEDEGALARLLRRDDADVRRLDARLVRDVMTTPAITIEEYWPVAEAAERMLESKINRLPVVRDGRLVGLVSRADLVRAFARADDEVLADARELVALQQEMLRDDRPVEIGVEHGEVLLTGEVRDPSEAEVLAKMVRTVPGVVSVRSELTWPR